ncbi:predicted protein [Botrytis cinerea T4]|uniref:Uncharacterized protein n=1 Tax=Botryotinia fuckeliana (strain T4) TaxID=999810 RepID=G2YI75_BOTF4|nr:predicted protein [Botrytis cinerea T4]
MCFYADDVDFLGLGRMIEMTSGGFYCMQIIVSESMNHQSYGRCKGDVLVVLSRTFCDTTLLYFDATRGNDTGKSGEFV